MLSFFRRLINSRVGVIVTFGILLVIALAFAAGDVTGLAGNGGGILGSSVVSVGGESVGAAELRKRAQDEVRVAQQRQPDITLAQFVASGGVEALVQRAVNSLALEAFGKEQGLAVSRALVGSELRNVPAFRGLNGQFDQQVYQRLIAQRGMTDAQVQRDVARETIARFLMVPTIGASQVPEQLALPYASLLLERRSGQVALIPAAAVPAPAAPSDAEVSQWYRRNIARYTVPEQRVLRYATATPAQVKARATPTDAEIAAYYRDNPSDYAPRELRDISWVTVLDEKAAQALAARVRDGATIAAAARAAGLEARTLSGQDKRTVSEQITGAAADALFAAPSGGVVGPVRGQIGQVVARVDKVTAVPGRTLAQARAEIVERLTARKTTDVLSKANAAIDDALAQDASFAEVAKENGLPAQVTPPLLANGTQFNVARPADAALAPIVTAGFAQEEGDTPTLVPLGQDGSFAVVAVDRVIAAAPLPLEQVRSRVVADIVSDKRARAARDVARAVVAKANRGMPLATALAQTGLRLPPPQPLASNRAAVNADPAKVSPVLVAMFSLRQGQAQLLASPENKGWLVVTADRIVPGDARRVAGVVQATRGDIGRAIGPEYTQQFANAVVAHVGAKRNADAIAQLKKDLAGQSGAAQ